jgi:hypothetical protein
VSSLGNMSLPSWLLQQSLRSVPKKRAFPFWYFPPFYGAVHLHKHHQFFATQQVTLACCTRSRETRIYFANNLAKNSEIAYTDDNISKWRVEANLDALEISITTIELYDVISKL